MLCYYIIMFYLQPCFFPPSDRWIFFFFFFFFFFFISRWNKKKIRCALLAVKPNTRGTSLPSKSRYRVWIAVKPNIRGTSLPSKSRYMVCSLLLQDTTLKHGTQVKCCKHFFSETVALIKRKMRKYMHVAYCTCEIYFVGTHCFGGTESVPPKQRVPTKYVSPYKSNNL